MNRISQYLRHFLAPGVLPVLFLLSVPVAARAQFSYLTNGSAITITGYTGTAGTVTIPSTVGDLPVTSIGDVAFYACSTLTNVTIPDSVSVIGWYAFEYCPNLTQVAFGNGVASIGDSAF